MLTNLYLASGGSTLNADALMADDPERWDSADDSEAPNGHAASDDVDHREVNTA